MKYLLKYNFYSKYFLVSLDEGFISFEKHFERIEQHTAI